MSHSKVQATLPSLDEAAFSASEPLEDHLKKVFLSYCSAEGSNLKWRFVKATEAAVGTSRATPLIALKWAQKAASLHAYTSARESHEELWRTGSLRGEDLVDLVERETLKSQFMAKRRAMIVQQAQEDLIEENSRLSEENDALRSRLDALEHARPCVFERRTGTITETLEEQIEVTYDLPEGPLKQVYNLDQIRGSKLPSEGDMVEARLSLVLIDRPEQNDSDFESPLPSFDDIESPSGEVQI